FARASARGARANSITHRRSARGIDFDARPRKRESQRRAPGLGATIWEQPMLQLTPGTTISHYRILETLGRGGQATAFKAEDLRLTRPVVIKALRPELAASETARRRFEREACLCSALDNPHIQGVYDVG